MARSWINSGVAGNCFFGGGIFALETFRLRYRMNVVFPRFVVSVKPKGLSHSAEGGLDRALHHSFALARLKAPISKGGTEADEDVPPVLSREI
jgi:hypothetical protein